MILKVAVLAATLAVSEASVEYVAGYRPETSVTDHNAIDLDQELINDLMGLPGADTFADAYRVYSEGASSKSYARLRLLTNQVSDITKDAIATGQGVDGSFVFGRVFQDISQVKNDDGTFNLEVAYETSEVQSNYMNCQVGGSTTPKVTGCFKANGTIDVGTVYGDFQYTYDPYENNYNDRTIKKMSTEANTKMKPIEPVHPGVKTGADGYFVHFQKFFDYYGVYDYGDQFMAAAFNQLETDFDNGDVDFRGISFEARAQSVKKGSNYMIITMYMIRAMEDAIDDCFHGCEEDECNDDDVHSLDAAVAYYSGSLEGDRFTASTGVLMYNLADKRCRNFNTCGEEKDMDDGISNINHQVFDQFALLQRALRDYQCASAISIKDKIVSLVYVPIIQGTLKYAWTKAYNGASYTDSLEGNVFAASVLPMVHYCNEEAAATIYKNMVAGKLDADYVEVKSAFESVYDCMGILCSEVGGQSDGTAYYQNAEPCQDGSAAYGIGSTIGYALMVLTGILSMAM